MTTLDGKVDLGPVGKVKKTYVAVAVAGIAGVVGWAWWSRSRATVDESAPDFYADTRTGSELPTDEYVNPAPGDDDDADPGWSAPRTDVEWAQAVVERLNWYEPAYASATVGKYLAGQALTTGEQTLIREAWAQVGRPPGNQRIVTGPASNPGSPGAGGGGYPPYPDDRPESPREPFPIPPKLAPQPRTPIRRAYT